MAVGNTSDENGSIPRSTRALEHSSNRYLTLKWSVMHKEIRIPVRKLCGMHDSCIAALAVSSCHDVMLLDCTMKNASVDAKNTIGLHLKFSSHKSMQSEKQPFCARFWEAWRVKHITHAVLGLVWLFIFHMMTSNGAGLRAPWLYNGGHHIPPGGTQPPYPPPVSTVHSFLELCTVFCR